MGVRSLLVSALTIALLAGCSSNKLVKTYEGETLAEGQVAILTAGENIALLSVNGEQVPDYLLSNISVNYGLKPGENVVVFQYESIWGKAKRGEDGPSAEVVESKPREVVINAKPGDKLAFVSGSAENVREARALAADFDADVINQKGKIVASSQDVREKKAARVAGQASANTQMNSAGEGLPALEAMKVLWSDLSAEEKKSFLKWAFQ